PSAGGIRPGHLTGELMSKLKLNVTMSLDGYIAGPNPTLDQPLGEGGERLHQWAIATRSFREMHGMGEGGTTGEDDAMVAGLFENMGATIMGRKMFSGVGGPWGDDPWRGWWGNNPPFHMPVFVLTHHAREPLPMEGGTTFHFVTDGIRSALDQARRGAGERLFENTDAKQRGFECVNVIASPAATHYKYRRR